MTYKTVKRLLTSCVHFRSIAASNQFCEWGFYRNHIFTETFSLGAASNICYAQGIVDSENRRLVCFGPTRCENWQHNDEGAENWAQFMAVFNAKDRTWRVGSSSAR